MMKHAPSLSKSLIFSAFAVTASLVLSGIFGSKAAQLEAQSSQHPVVVELFTSQGCSSCPPADAILGELASRADIIALSLPVDYWDNLGWPDTLAAPAHTQRQKTYAQKLGTRRVYTPQMVINGSIDVVGSRREQVLTQIEAEQARQHNSVHISLTAKGDNLIISLGQAPTTLNLEQASVWIVPFHTGQHDVMIKAGENKGRTISYSNVVDGLMRLGNYYGSAQDFAHSLAPLQNKKIDGCAVIIQDNKSGAIIGAQRINLGALE